MISLQLTKKKTWSNAFSGTLFNYRRSENNARTLSYQNAWWRITEAMSEQLFSFV